LVGKLDSGFRRNDEIFVMAGLDPTIACRTRQITGSSPVMTKKKSSWPDLIRPSHRKW
jgi:hypothetical protein